MGKIDILNDMGYEDAVVFAGPEYNDAIVGITDDGRVVYDYNLMIECLMEADGIEYDEAMEFVEYNTIRACDYMENPPIIMHPIVE